ncbi:hypothetical protein FD755_020200 [Muntiacus reevesi]|uniref:Small integral membrane protein 14 n=1 Tax=Muntiacus reevesi TaxID=9886 RepID=A0A5N3X7S4_MUNRE|nr:hypothetical protein FD755_020200 [Muntiacus reevesi]
MAEGGFDPCECVCSHEHAMRRLINLYRGPTISYTWIFNWKEGWRLYLLIQRSAVCYYYVIDYNILFIIILYGVYYYRPVNKGWFKHLLKYLNCW